MNKIIKIFCPIYQIIEITNYEKNGEIVRETKIEPVKKSFLLYIPLIFTIIYAIITCFGLNL